MRLAGSLAGAGSAGVFGGLDGEPPPRPPIISETRLLDASGGDGDAEFCDGAAPEGLGSLEADGSFDGAGDAG